MNWLGIALIAFVVFVLLLLIRIYTWADLNEKRSSLYFKKRPYSEDTVLKTYKSKQNNNTIKTVKVCMPNEEVSQVVSQYIINKEGNKVTLIIEYLPEKEHTNTKIYIYNKKKQLIFVSLLKDDLDKRYSNIIGLPENSEYINIELQTEDLKPADYNIYKIQKHLIVLDTILMFAGLTLAIFLIEFLVSGYLMPYYHLNRGLYISLELFVIVCILNYIISSSILKKRKFNG